MKTTDNDLITAHTSATDPRKVVLHVQKPWMALSFWLTLEEAYELSADLVEAIRVSYRVKP